jgi:protein-tyrosine kinase
VLTAADAMAFSPYVDAALLVVEEGKTKQDDVQRAVEMLKSTRIIGTVLNKSLELEMPEEINASWFKRVFKRGSH